MGQHAKTIKLLGLAAITAYVCISYQSFVFCQDVSPMSLLTTQVSLFLLRLCLVHHIHPLGIDPPLGQNFSHENFSLISLHDDFQ